MAEQRIAKYMSIRGFHWRVQNRGVSFGDNEAITGFASVLIIRLKDKRCHRPGADHNGRMIVNGKNSCSGPNRRPARA
jgi:hypothetical protein